MNGPIRRVSLLSVTLSGTSPPLNDICMLRMHNLNPANTTDVGKDLASGYDEVVEFLNDLHDESMEIFSNLSSQDLQKKTITPGNISITLWKWLRAMVEHEVHHRGQIYMYLSLLNVSTPPLYGLTSEEVQERSTHGLFP